MVSLEETWYLNAIVTFHSPDFMLVLVPVLYLSWWYVDNRIYRIDHQHVLITYFGKAKAYHRVCWLAPIHVEKADIMTFIVMVKANIAIWIGPVFVEHFCLIIFVLY